MKIRGERALPATFGIAKTPLSRLGPLLQDALRCGTVHDNERLIHVINVKTRGEVYK